MDMGMWLPSLCRRASATAVGAKKPKKSAKAAPPRHVVPVDERKEAAAAWPGCRVEAAGEGGLAAVRVKVVMKKKDAEQLMARLRERSARERKARMEELKSQLGGDGGRCAESPCRDAPWTPRLASIPEN